MKISDKLRAAVEASPLKKREIAERAGITQVALSKYISGVVQPKQENLTKIAKALGMDISAFLLDESEAAQMAEELQEWKERAMKAERQLENLKKVLPLISEANAILSKNFESELCAHKMYNDEHSVRAQKNNAREYERYRRAAGF